MSYQDVKGLLYRGHKKVANNTYLNQDDPEEEMIDMRLHGNIVARFYPEYLELYSAGWGTPTTKDRLNLALKLAKVKGWKGVYQDNWKWYYGRYHKGDHEFHEGIRINYDGEVIDYTPNFTRR